MIEDATRADVIIKLFPATACSVWQNTLHIKTNSEATYAATPIHTVHSSVVIALGFVERVRV